MGRKTREKDDMHSSLALNQYLESHTKSIRNITGDIFSIYPVIHYDIIQTFSDSAPQDNSSEHKINLIYHVYFSLTTTLLSLFN